jgi:hypothetical protein
LSASPLYLPETSTRPSPRRFGFLLPPRSGAQGSPRISRLEVSLNGNEPPVVRRQKYSLRPDGTGTGHGNRNPEVMSAQVGDGVRLLAPGRLSQRPRSPLDRQFRLYYFRGSAASRVRIGRNAWKRPERPARRGCVAIHADPMKTSLEPKLPHANTCPSCSARGSETVSSGVPGRRCEPHCASPITCPRRSF